MVRIAKSLYQNAPHHQGFKHRYHRSKKKAFAFGGKDHFARRKWKKRYKELGIVNQMEADKNAMLERRYGITAKRIRREAK